MTALQSHKCECGFSPLCERCRQQEVSPRGSSVVDVTASFSRELGEPGVSGHKRPQQFSVTAIGRKIGAL